MNKLQREDLLLEPWDHNSEQDGLYIWGNINVVNIDSVISELDDIDKYDRKQANNN